MDGQPCPGRGRNGDGIDGCGRARRRKNRSDRSLIEGSCTEIRSKAVVIGIMRTIVNVLMQVRCGRDQAHREDLDEREPDQGCEYAVPAGPFDFQFHAGGTNTQRSAPYKIYLGAPLLSCCGFRRLAPGWPRFLCKRSQAWGGLLCGHCIQPVLPRTSGFVPDGSLSDPCRTGR